MGKFRLKTYDQSPPGSFPYEQRGSHPRLFPSEPLIEAQARNVSAYRSGNNLPRASYAESLVDVDNYTCRRLGNNPQFCIPVDAATPNQVALTANAPGLAPCAGCGVRVS
jgi:hypothetical protein